MLAQDFKGKKRSVVMFESDDGNRKVSRRIILQRVACAAAVPALVAAVSTVPALAKAKSSQSAAKYQPTPKDDQRCDNCALWQAPDACKVVSGTIAPEGWCKLWVPAPK
jgi:hypothetical protein